MTNQNITFHSPNVFIKHKDYAEIVVRYQNNNERYRAKIDLKDVELLKNYKWCDRKGYVINHKIGRLHRFLTNCPKNMVVDHINHDKTDNRRCNLRICTLSQNYQNRKASGVVLDKGKWRAHICVNYKRLWLGRFSKKEEAVKARREAEKVYFGKFAYMYDSQED